MLAGAGVLACRCLILIGGNQARSLLSVCVLLCVLVAVSLRVAVCWFINGGLPSGLPSGLPTGLLSVQRAHASGCMLLCALALSLARRLPGIMQAVYLDMSHC